MVDAADTPLHGARSVGVHRQPSFNAGRERRSSDAATRSAAPVGVATAGAAINCREGAAVCGHRQGGRPLEASSAAEGGTSHGSRLVEYHDRYSSAASGLGEGC